jgi:glycosyltransferase involved in cell wall biosynthesis
VLQRFGDRIKLVVNAHGGHVSALNASVAACRGDVLIFLDADDFLHPNCVNRVITCWRAGLSKIQFRLDTIDAHGQSAPAFSNISFDVVIRGSQATVA